MLMHGLTSNFVDASDYFEFTITPESGYQFSIREISIEYEKEKNGPNSFVVTNEFRWVYTQTLEVLFNIPRI